ncbi:MAG: hypothetical protein KIT33_00830 [Candidatus Kapabacteria bacterium]|nr:hypothetical protein [Ignavibacteriota bacterium]MCW5883491.1 hypothetical protein [Candidatus Kapabacteria bacterium]
MKKIFIYITILLFIVTALNSQEIPLESKEQSKEIEKIEQPVEPNSVEKNVKENIEQNKNNPKLDELKQRRQKRNEHFIDKDGDGINDNRCNGFGMQRGKGKGKRSGKK